MTTRTPMNEATIADRAELRSALSGSERARDDVPQVGAPDPELRTSPLVDEDDERALDFEQPTAACYFNGVAYRCGRYVKSGSELLHCEAGGVWVRRGEVRR